MHFFKGSQRYMGGGVFGTFRVSGFKLFWFQGLGLLGFCMLSGRNHRVNIQSSLDMELICQIYLQQSFAAPITRLGG